GDGGEYCAPLHNGEQLISWSEFSLDCLTDGKYPYDGREPLKVMMIIVDPFGHDIEAADVAYKVCVEELSTPPEILIEY
ncbi:MAG: hypothetical protein JXX14_25360, partial [Deltaproteobacteria bacterium]|nr:hypothetical protein [Deltaproteobacteria bacterium]